MQQTIEEIIKIQAKGVLTIPKNLRKNFLGDNSLVRIRKENGRLILEPVLPIPYPIRKYTVAEIKEFIDLDKLETQELKKSARLGKKISGGEFLLDLAKQAEKLSKKIKTKAPADLSRRIDHYLYGKTKNEYSSGY